MIVMLTVSSLLLVGCEDFLDVNTSKDSAITVTLDQQLPTACFYAAFLNYDHAEYGVYMSQALTTSSKSQTGSYPYSQGWEFLSVNRHPMWRRHFYDLGANIQKMNENAEKENSRNYELIGRTIMLMSTMFTTDCFGDMPREEAYTSTSPHYDSQAKVYEWMFQEADELIDLYEDSKWIGDKCKPITEKQDRIYKGDMKKWEVFCKALRCRLWLRKLPNWDNNPATCQKIIAMVDEVLNDPNWEECIYHFPGGKSEQNCPWGPYAPKINSWESRDNRLSSSMPTTFFAKAILGAYTQKGANRRYALDPRAENMMTPRTGPTGAGSEAIRYLESNYGIDVSMKVTHYPDLFASSTLTNPYTQNDGYLALMTTEELMFIKAEAQYWAGDKGGAYETTVAATKMNMERYGVYEASLVGQAVTRYNRFFEVKLPGAATFTIGDLMQQKYVAMYLQAEQWTDLRRYNYSSKTNGIQYDNCFVYTSYTCHDGKMNAFAVSNFTQEYSLRRPYNLYASYWDTDECYASAQHISTNLSPNAWVNRLNPDTETETKYNREELIRIGAALEGGSSSGAANVDWHWMQKRMIWQYNNSGKAECSNSIEWK